MVSWFLSVHPVLQAFFATLFTWFVTAAGAATVFASKSLNKKTLDAMLGFAAGVMIAASFWSLLAPGIELAENMGMNAWMMAAFGFLSGGVALRLADILLPHIHPGTDLTHTDGPKSSMKRSTLLVVAITLHNIPEGLAVGVAFGAVAAGIPSASIGSAIALAIGIGIQNFPEGAAVSFPLYRDGMSRWKSFLIGQYSGMVEPVAGVIGAVFVMYMQSFLPFALCFAAGAMIFVVVEELIPESQKDPSNIDTSTMATMLGFAVMMMLDVGLG